MTKENEKIMDKNFGIAFITFASLKDCQELKREFKQTKKELSKLKPEVAKWLNIRVSSYTLLNPIELDDRRSPLPQRHHLGEHQSTELLPRAQSPDSEHPPLLHHCSFDHPHHDPSFNRALFPVRP
jgi:hypothetical protein